VKLSFHAMDIRELRKAFQQNEKAIAELFAVYRSRYTTKANVTMYRLMVIALEAELQNVLFKLSGSRLDRATGDVKAVTAKYQKIVNGAVASGFSGAGRD